MSTHAESDVLRGIGRSSRPAGFGESGPTFVSVYEANVGAITAYFARRSVEPQTLADLTSETFVEALGSIERFNPARGTPRAWLFGIARIVHARHRQRAASGQAAIEGLAGRIVLDADEIDELAARIDDQRDGRALLASYAELPPLERAALELVDIDGMSPREAASSLNVTSSVLRARLFRGRSRLRNQRRNP